MQAIIRQLRIIPVLNVSKRRAKTDEVNSACYVRLLNWTPYLSRRSIRLRRPRETRLLPAEAILKPVHLTHHTLRV